MKRKKEKRTATRLASEQRYRLSKKGKMTKAAHNRRYRTTENGKIARRKAGLKYRHNVTDAIYNQLMVEQSGCCAICTGHQTEFKRRLEVDHDHKTGKIRGLLCGKCNRAIGLMDDDPRRLKGASKYLQEMS